MEEKWSFHRRIVVVAMLMAALSCVGITNGNGDDSGSRRSSSHQPPQSSTLTAQVAMMRTVISYQRNPPAATPSPTATAIPSDTGTPAAVLPPRIDGTAEFEVEQNVEYYSSDITVGRNFIVWDAPVDGNWEILGYDIVKQSKFAITDYGGKQNNPETDGSVVVWQDSRTVLPRIRGYDLDTGQEFLVTAESSPQWTPDVSGKIVVFQDWRKSGTCSWGGSDFGPSTYCDWDIWGVNLETREEFPVTQKSGVQSSPAVSGNWTTWWDAEEKSYYAYELGSEEKPFRVGGRAVDGDVLIDLSGVSPQGRVVSAFQLSSRSTFPIHYSNRDVDYKGVDVGGNVVVWSDDRSGEFDIYGYHLATGEEFSICLEPGDQVEPKVDGNTVVWKDGRNGDTDVYGARLPFENGRQTSKIIAASPLPTQTPIPAASQTAAASPSSTRFLNPPPATLISPADGEAVFSRAPLLLFDLGFDISQIGFGSGFETQIVSDPEFRFDCIYSTYPSSVWMCFPAENLAPGKYRWSVRTKLGECYSNPLQCRSAQSETWTFIVTDEDVPMPETPVLLSPKNGSKIRNGGDFLFQWEPVEGAVFYNASIYRKDSGEGVCYFSHLLDASMQCPGLTPGTYGWYVDVYNGYGWRHASATFTILD